LNEDFGSIGVLNHKRLAAWQESIDFATEVYGVTKKFPMEERFGLTSQLRRSAVSVASNIAEGSSRNSIKETIHFLYNALGSLSEADTQLTIAQRVGFLPTDFDYESKTNSIRAKLWGLIKMLEERNR